MASRTRRCTESCHAILHTLGVANNELSLAEINVLHSEVQSFKQA